MDCRSVLRFCSNGAQIRRLNNMEFRVLGPIEVSDGNRNLPLGGFRQRLVLSALLLHPNRSVTTDWLVDAVWGEAPPRTARKTLQVYISRLRSLLGAHAIEATSTGYILRLDPDVLDSNRFEQFADEGHRLLGIDPAAAAGALRRALSLWRGIPWGQFGDEPALQPEAQRLRERRLLAVEDRIEADLGTGHAAALIGELEGLVAEYPWRERFRAQLMLALYRAGRQSDALREFQSARRFLGEELGIEPSVELRDLEGKILLQDPAIADPGVEIDVEDWTKARNPYKGLRPFRTEDDSDFFGRAELVATLAATIETRRFAAVVGPSGSGKSSVVMAGLIPQLSPDRWVVATMLPGHDPFSAVRQALLGLGLEPQLDAERGDNLDLLRAVQSAIPEDGPRLLLVIDQFEELFLQVPDEAVRARFVRNLAEAVEDPSVPLTVLITLRADALDLAMEHAALGELIGSEMVGVLPLRAHELEAAATRPAERVGVHTEPELIAELVGVMTDQPGALPLFQYVLTQLFENRTGPVLTRAAYRKLGGLDGALSRRAEETFALLEPDVQVLMRQVLMRLVTVDPALGYMRRREERQSLESLDSRGRVKVALDAFGDARLLTFDRNPATGRATVEVAHEALLREWPRMRGWLEAAQEDLRLHGALVTELVEWQTSDCDPDYLLTGSRLALYDQWRINAGIELSEEEESFLAASVARRDEERAQERARQTEQLRLERRSVRRLRTVVIVVSVAALVAAGLTLLAANRSREAAASQREARARELANASLVNLETDAELAILLAIEAIEVTQSIDGSVVGEAEQALHQAVSASRLVATHRAEWDVEFHPNGGLLVAGNEARLIDPITGESLFVVPPPGEGRHVESMAVSSDGRLLATGTNGAGTRHAELVVWDATSGAEVQRFAAQPDTITAIEFSPDGRLLASISPWGGGVRVWDVATGEPVAHGYDAAAWDDCCPPVRLAFSPDGAHVAASTMTGDVLRLDVARNELLAPLRGHEGPVTAIQYLPDGGGMVTSSWDETIRMWSSNGEELATIEAGVGPVDGLAVSDDGLYMLTAGDTGTVRLWKLYPGGAEPIAALSGHRAEVFDVTFSSDGVLAASVALDGEVRVWDITPSGRGEIAAWAGDGPVAFSPDGTMLAVADPQSRNVTVRPAGGGQPGLVLPVAPYTGGTVSGEDWGLAGSVEFSPDGRYLASTNFAWQVMPGSLTLWETTSGVEQQTLLQHPFLRGPVAFSGDGHRIAVATCTYPNPSSTASVIDVVTGDRIFATPYGSCGHAADLDPLGERLAVTTEDEVNNVSVWDLSTGQVVAQMTDLMPMGGVVRFSPDGARLLTTGRDGFGRIWDASSGELLLELEGHTGPVQDGIWVSDSTAATVSGDGTARLWDTRSGENLLTLPLDRGFPYVAASHDERRLATSSGDHVRVWTLDLDELLDIARGRLTRSLSAAECVTYHFEDCPVSP